MKYIIAILFVFAGLSAFAQKQEMPLVQFTGIVYNADSVKSIVPYANITNQTTHKVVNTSNYQGYFSFVVHEQDTLVFTSVGYASTKVIIPANVSSKSYTVQVLLKPQIFNLPTVHIFPWATTDEFKKDFIAMKVADDDLGIAQKNVSKTALMALMSTLPRDGQEIQTANYSNFHESIVNQHSITPNPLLNPLAWGSFINQITQGDKSRGSN